VQVDFSRPKVALLQRVARIGELTGMGSQRPNPDPGTQQKPTTGLVPHDL